MPSCQFRRRFCFVWGAPYGPSLLNQPRAFRLPYLFPSYSVVLLRTPQLWVFEAERDVRINPQIEPILRNSRW
jgi:hypothetical protein